MMIDHFSMSVHNILSTPFAGSLRLDFRNNLRYFYFAVKSNNEGIQNLKKRFHPNVNFIPA